MVSTLRIAFLTDAKQLKSIVHRTTALALTKHQPFVERNQWQSAETPSTKRKRLFV
jgi:hypothetical protein